MLFLYQLFLPPLLTHVLPINPYTKPFNYPFTSPKFTPISTTQILPLQLENNRIILFNLENRITKHLHFVQHLHERIHVTQRTQIVNSLSLRPSFPHASYYIYSIFSAILKTANSSSCWYITYSFVKQPD